MLSQPLHKQCLLPPKYSSICESGSISSKTCSRTRAFDTETDKVSVKKLLNFWEGKTQQKVIQKPDDSCSISCSVKTIYVDEALIYEVQLECKSCLSIFILRAAHDCNSITDGGLEWLKGHNQEHVNLAL